MFPPVGPTAATILGVLDAINVLDGHNNAFAVLINAKCG
jgi:hypothetical protein